MLRTTRKPADTAALQAWSLTPVRSMLWNPPTTTTTTTVLENRGPQTTFCIGAPKKLETAPFGTIASQVSRSLGSKGYAQISPPTWLLSSICCCAVMIYSCNACFDNMPLSATLHPSTLSRVIWHSLAVFILTELKRNADNHPLLIIWDQSSLLKVDVQTKIWINGNHDGKFVFYTEGEREVFFLLT